MCSHGVNQKGREQGWGRGRYVFRPHQRERYASASIFTLTPKVPTGPPPAGHPPQCVFLDKLFENRPIQRFWFLEVSKQQALAAVLALFWPGCPSHPAAAKARGWPWMDGHQEGHPGSMHSCACLLAGDCRLLLIRCCFFTCFCADRSAHALLLLHLLPAPLREPWWVQGLLMALELPSHELTLTRGHARCPWQGCVHVRPSHTLLPRTSPQNTCSCGDVLACMHAGWWRAAAELRKIHFAEEWNELHHLQVRLLLGACLAAGPRPAHSPQPSPYA